MKINVEVKGITPLLMNKFDMTGEKADKNATPREVAEKKAYRLDDGKFFIPMTWMYGAMMNAGRNIKLGKRQISTRDSSMLASGAWIDEEVFILSNDDFEVDSRPVVVPATGGRIVAHRPRFDEWSFSFSLTVDEQVFGEKLIRELIDDAGKKVGIGDFRPERKGWFGRFVVTKWEVDKKANAIKVAA